MEILREINSIPFVGEGGGNSIFSQGLGCVCVCVYLGGWGMEIFKDFVLSYF